MLKTWYKHIFFNFLILNLRIFLSIDPSLVWNSYLVFGDRYAIPLDFTDCYHCITQENKVWFNC